MLQLKLPRLAGLNPHDIYLKFAGKLPVRLLCEPAGRNERWVGEGWGCSACARLPAVGARYPGCASLPVQTNHGRFELVPVIGPHCPPTGPPCRMSQAPGGPLALLLSMRRGMLPQQAAQAPPRALRPAGRLGAACSAAGGRSTLQPSGAGCCYAVPARVLGCPEGEPWLGL